MFSVPKLHYQLNSPCWATWEDKVAKSLCLQLPEVESWVKSGLLMIIKNCSKSLYHDIFLYRFSSEITLHVRECIETKTILKFTQASDLYSCLQEAPCPGGAKQQCSQWQLLEASGAHKNEPSWTITSILNSISAAYFLNIKSTLPITQVQINMNEKLLL